MDTSRFATLTLLCIAVMTVMPAQAMAQTLTETFDQPPLQNWELQGAQVVPQDRMGNVLQFQEHGFAGWAVNPGPSFTLQMSMMVQPQSMFAVAFLASGEPPNQNEYQLVHEGGGLHLVKITNGQETPLGSGPGLQPNTWTTVSLQFNAGQMTVTAGNQPILNATDRQPLTQGMLGFHGMGAAIDNVTLTGAAGAAPMQPVQMQPIQQPEMPPGGQVAQPPPQPTGQPVQPMMPPPGPPAGQAPTTMQQMPGVPGQQLPSGQQTVLPPPTGPAAGAMATMYQPLQTTPFRIFLQLPNLQPGATRIQGKDYWIEVFDWSLALSGSPSWNWGASPALAKIPPGTAGPLVVYKPFDHASADIIRRWAEAEFISEATLEVNNDLGGGNFATVLEIKLKNVKVLSVTRHVASIWGPGVEEVQFTFGEFQWIQHEIQPGGMAERAGPYSQASFRCSTGGMLVPPNR